MPTKKLIFVLLLMSFIVFAGNAYSLPMFPDPQTNALQYGDFYSYSLPVLDYFDDGNQYKSGDTWHVAAAQPKDNPIVIYTNANNIDDNPAGMDDAYESITGNTGTFVFNTSTTTDPPPADTNGNAPPNDPAFSGDSDDYWDTELQALLNHLNGSDMFFFFQNAEKQSTDADGFPQKNLFAWGQVIIRDVDSNLPDLYFDFTDVNTSNDVTQYANTNGLGPVNDFTDKNDPGDFVLSGGDVCLDANGSNVACDGNQAVRLPHNLGSNEAAYAIYSPEINDNLGLWSNNGYDVLSIDMRLRELDNGPDDFFILAATAYEEFVPVPEPSTFLLMGAGLVLLLFVRRKSWR